jgi:hypothetical protein
LAFKHPTLWYEADLFDEFTDTFGGFQAGMLRVQGLGQVHHLVTVEFGKVRVQSRLGRRGAFQLTKKVLPPGFETGHLILYGGPGHARLDRFDYSVDLPLGLLHIACDKLALKKGEHLLKVVPMGRRSTTVRDEHVDQRVTPLRLLSRDKNGIGVAH